MASEIEKIINELEIIEDAEKPGTWNAVYRGDIIETNTRSDIEKYGNIKIKDSMDNSQIKKAIKDFVEREIKGL